MTWVVSFNASSGRSGAEGGRLTSVSSGTKAMATAIPSLSRRMLLKSAMNVVPPSVSEKLSHRTTFRLPSCSSPSITQTVSPSSNTPSS